MSERALNEGAFVLSQFEGHDSHTAGSLEAAHHGGRQLLTSWGQEADQPAERPNRKTPDRKSPNRMGSD